MEEEDLLKHLAILDYFIHLHLNTRLNNDQIVAHDYALIISRILTMLKRFTPQLPLDSCLEERLRLAKLMGMSLFTSECQGSIEGPCCPEHWRQNLILVKQNHGMPVEDIDRQIFILSRDWQEAKALGLTAMPSEGSWEVVRAELRRQYPVEQFKLVMMRVFRDANALLEAPLISKMSGQVMTSQESPQKISSLSQKSSPIKVHTPQRNTPLKLKGSPLGTPTSPLKSQRDPQLEFARVVKRWAEHDIQVHQAIHRTSEEVQAEWQQVYEPSRNEPSLPPSSFKGSSPKKSIAQKSAPPSPMTQAPHQPSTSDKKRKGRSLTDRHESAQKVQWTISSNDDRVDEVENQAQTSGRRGRLLNPHPADDEMQQQKKGRRFWTNSEINNLVSGYRRFGPRWATIAASYQFEDRTPVDLKDKHRNLVQKYGEEFFQSFE